ncbi:MAG TPA: redoxin domain-containing protein [Planctomycetes bacterium]|nr:redoxin domain-containing protein [Planctomycetaceae bacterium]HIN54259.1 redoxin domain-containing protein [Planctomycetota bacterium]
MRIKHMTLVLFTILSTVVLWQTSSVTAVVPAKALSIGKVAPEIEAEDIDGVKFKLSDYRGKVVVLDFWGDW